LKVSVALWAFLPDYEDWRFILSGRKFDAAGLKAYGLLHDTLDAAGFSLEETPIVGVFDTSDPFIRSLRKTFGKTKSVTGMRLGGRTFVIATSKTPTLIASLSRPREARFIPVTLLLLAASITLEGKRFRFCWNRPWSVSFLGPGF
jgi:hypothetical protein